MTDFTKRSANEAETHELMHKVRAVSDAPSVDIIVANVFQAMWSSSLTVDQVTAIGEAMFGFRNLNVQECLTRLARKRILRSRMVSGKRHYEVNY